MYVGFSLIDLNRAVNAKRWKSFWLFTVLTLVSILTSTLVSYRIIKPLGRLSRGMRKISHGDLSGTVDIRSRDENGALEYNPEFYASYQNIARIYYEKGDLDRATQYYRQYMEAAPNDPLKSNALVVMAIYSAQQGQSQEVLTYLKELRNLVPFTLTFPMIVRITIFKDSSRHRLGKGNATGVNPEITRPIQRYLRIDI